MFFVKRFRAVNDSNKIYSTDIQRFKCQCQCIEKLKDMRTFLKGGSLILNFVLYIRKRQLNLPVVKGIL